MKKITIALAICFLGISLAADSFSGIANDDFRQALYKAVDSAIPSLKKAKFGKMPIAVLPMKSDPSNVIPERLRTILNQLGFACVVGKEETEMMNRIYSEIATSERQDDIADPATLVKFGKLKNTQLLMSCRILNKSQDSNRVFVEIELNVVEIATRKRVWSGVFACRHYPGKDVQGIVKMDPELAALLKKELGTISTALNNGITQGKLGNNRKIVIIPISGDIDRYITDMVTSALSQTRYTPEYTDIPTVSQFRYAVADGSVGTKVVCYGAVRDLHITAPVKKFSPDKRSQIITKTLRGEVQLTIEDASTKAILWSQNFSVNVPQEEIKDLPRDYKEYLWIAAGVIAIILVLFVIFLVIVKLFATRNNIR